MENGNTAQSLVMKMLVPPKLQLIMVSILAAHLIAHSIFGTVGASYLITFLIFFSVFGILGEIILRLIVRQRTSPATRHMEQAISEIKELNLEEARKRAYQLLEDDTKFKCVKAGADLQVPYQLSTSLQEFFSIYESVKAVAGEAQLSKNLFGLSEYQKGFLRIGTDLSFTEIVVRPGEDGIYLIDGSEVSEEDFASSKLPSVYHWVLETAEVLYGGDRL